MLFPTFKRAGHLVNRPGQSRLRALKTQLVIDVERMHAESMDLYGYQLENVAVPCLPGDLEEVRMLLEDLYPNSNYRAVAVEDQ